MVAPESTLGFAKGCNGWKKLVLKTSKKGLRYSTNVINRHVSSGNRRGKVHAMRPSGNALLLEALGLTLKERRLELGLTQEDVAGEAAIDRPYITLIEAARKQPTVSVFWKLAHALQLRPGELATRVDERYVGLTKVASKRN